MTNDLAIGKVTEGYRAGIVSFRLAIHDQDHDGDVEWDYVPAWSGQPEANPGKYPIRAHIYQCKDLPPSDDNGTSDPYIKIWSPFEPDENQKKKIKTRTVFDNNNPIFYQSIESYFYSAELDWSPPIILEIFDADSGTFDTDDFIGRSIIKLSEASLSYNEEIPRPQWHPVKLGYGKDEPTMGQILVSFNVLEPKKAFKKSLDSIRLTPACEEYEITINVLGLRNLQSPGVLPVRKPFVKFMLRSLLPPSKANAIDNIETQPFATGADPTISTVLKFKISLPNDSLYCPSLN